jgi:hypothetical protein
MSFVFSNFLASFQVFSYNSFVSIYLLASFPLPFIVFNNILASVVLFFVFLKPLPLECPGTVPLFLSHPAIPAPAYDNVSVI